MTKRGRPAIPDPVIVNVEKAYFDLNIHPNIRDKGLRKAHRMKYSMMLHRRGVFLRAMEAGLGSKWAAYIAGVSVKTARRYVKTLDVASQSRKEV